MSARSVRWLATLSARIATPSIPAFPALTTTLAAGLLLLAAGGCGKKGPPLPPLSSAPDRVAHVGVKQVGDRLIVTFPRPQKRTDGQPLAPDAEIEILMSGRDPVPRHPGEIETAADIRWVVPRAQWDLYAQGRRLEVPLRLGSIATSLQIAAGEAALKGRKLSFLVDVVEAKRKRSLPSDIETFMVCDPSSAPPSAAGRILENGLLLIWSAGAHTGAPPGPGSQPSLTSPSRGTTAPSAPTLVAPAGPRFHLYRQEEGEPRPETPTQTVPLDTFSFLDPAPMPGHTYRYTVRATAGVDRCESGDSPLVAMSRVDLFPPAPPQALAAVYETADDKGTIRLFWRPNREPDLQGYRVYRAVGPDGAWKLLTPEDLVATSYTDADVSPGVVYSYCVTARDSSVPPNESLFSDPATEKTEPGH